LKRIKRGVLVEQYFSDKTVVSMEMWPDETVLKSTILRPQRENDIEEDINLTIIDLPEIHAFKNAYSHEYYTKLGRITNLDLFENPVIRATIDRRWPLIQYYTSLFLLVPFVIYLSVFLAFSNAYNFLLLTSENEKNSSFAIIIVLFIFSCYFLLIEIY
jgi:hypothetical protein